MWSRERILILIPVTLILGSLLLFTFPQLTNIPCFSLISEQRTEEEFLAWMRTQLERRARVAKVCASDLSLRDSPQQGANVMRYSFLFNPDHNILGCLQPKVRHLVLLQKSLIKVGSTTWHQHFVSLANERRRTQLEKHKRKDQASI